MAALIARAIMQDGGSRPLGGAAARRDGGGDDSGESSGSDSDCNSSSSTNKFKNVRDRSCFEAGFRIMQLCTKAKGFREWMSLLLMKHNCQVDALSLFIPLKLTRHGQV